MDNMPILWQNALMQFRTEIARKAWVWFAETRGHGMQYEADAYAGEVDALVGFIRPLLKRDCEVMDDLMRFILKRHANWRLGANIIPTFLQGGADHG